ncbi:hypothetical protein [Streptomyces sp. NPDC059597]|uniref:hypothetical protein n=1 Tax=Streptomyces sp. NPDC059597 TaxID=3346879 RepID=UPI00368A5332
MTGAERLASDLPAVQRIAGLPGHLPLALSAIGRHMRDHPAWALGDYYREPLITLALEEGVRTALATSDARLSQGAGRLLRLLALHPPTEVEIAGAAALLGESSAATEHHLTALAAEHLIERTAPHRFRVHPLTHAHAEERLCIDEPATHIRLALTRLSEHGHSWGADMRLEARTVRGLRLPVPRQHAASDGERNSPLPQPRTGRVLAA